jgi:hypothetical protein
MSKRQGAHREASPCREYAAPEDLGRSIARKQRSMRSRRERASASKVEWMREKERVAALLEDQRRLGLQEPFLWTES